MYKIGLTGGVATGKSTVSNILRNLGAVIIDADVIAREVVAKGSPCLDKIAAYFGNDVLLEDGSLDRKKLGDMVFADKAKLERLNAIVHPAIIDRVAECLGVLDKKQGSITAVIDAAILIETGLDRMVDCIWLVWADRETQLERLIARDGISREKAQNIIRSQMPMEDKVKFADVIIDNIGSMENLEARVRELWRKE